MSFLSGEGKIKAVRKRTGEFVPFDPAKIQSALTRAGKAALPTDGNGGPGPRRGVVEHSELIEVSAVPVPLDPESLAYCLRTVFRRARTLAVVAHP